MPAEYHKLGFRFLYPDSWKLAADESAEWPRSVSVHSPCGAFWSVTADNWPCDSLLERIVEALSKEYEEVESQPIERQIGPHDLVGVELHFYCLDMLVTAQVLECPGLRLPLAILMQGENRDFDSLAQVFDAMSLSLLQNAVKDD